MPSDTLTAFFLLLLLEKATRRSMGSNRVSATALPAQGGPGKQEVPDPVPVAPAAAGAHHPPRRPGWQVPLSPEEGEGGERCPEAARAGRGSGFRWPSGG